MRDRGSTRRCVRFLFGCRKLFRAERGVMRQSFVKRETEDHIAAFIAAVADRVFPFLLVIVVLLFGPGLAGREQNGFRIRGPGKGVYFFVTRGDGKGLAAVGRNQKELGDVLVFTFVFILARFSFVVARVGAIAGFGRIAFGKERDPLGEIRKSWATSLSLPLSLFLPDFPSSSPVSEPSLDSVVLRSERNAIHWPSGDHCGEVS